MTGTNVKPDRVRWSPIAPLSNDEVGTDFSEVDGLRRQWLEVKERVESSNPQAYTRFNEELSREWAIETGIIEGLYELNHGITQTLIQHGFVGEYVEPGSTNIPSDELIAILKDHVEAIDGIDAWIRESRPLSVSLIRNLHQAVVRNQPTYRAMNQFGQFFDAKMRPGEFKTVPNNPTRPDGVVHEYCPPVQVDSEIKNLVQWYTSFDGGQHHPLAIAAWLHHRFTQIHPFADGNGRVARGLLTWHLVRKEYLPVVVTRDIRYEYITTLEQADGGDIVPLVRLLVRLERDTLFKALSVEHVQIPSVDTVDEVLGFIVDGMRRKRREQEDRLRSVLQTAQQLRENALEILQSESNRIIRQLQDSTGLSMVSDFLRGGPDESNEYYYRRQVMDTARSAGHWVNFQEHRYFVRVRLRDTVQSGAPTMEFVISLHSVGRSLTGVMAATSFMQKRYQNEYHIQDDGTDDDDLDVCSLDPFILTVSDSLDDLKPRFEDWVKRCFSLALLVWGKAMIEQS